MKQKQPTGMVSESQPRSQQAASLSRSQGRHEQPSSGTDTRRSDWTASTETSCPTTSPTKGEWLNGTPEWGTTTPKQLADAWNALVRHTEHQTGKKYVPYGGHIESKEDEDMAKKAIAQSTVDNIVNEAKEDSAMTETTEQTSKNGIPMGTTQKGRVYYMHSKDVERHLPIRQATKLGRTKNIGVTSCIPGLTAENITKDEAEIALLGKACRKFGWTNGVCTVAKALAHHGTPNPEYDGHGWFVKYANAKSETDGTVAYPMEAFVWNTESGQPEPVTEKQPKRKPRKTRRSQTSRRTSRTTTTKKVEQPAAVSEDIAALIATVNRLTEQNAQLTAALISATK